MLTSLRTQRTIRRYRQSLRTQGTREMNPTNPSYEHTHAPEPSMRSTQRRDEWTVNVELYSSGRAFEQVEQAGVERYSAWFDMEHKDQSALDDYAMCVLISTMREHT